MKLAHGQRRLLFSNVKGATEAIRRLSAAQRDPGVPTNAPANHWAPPSTDALADTSDNTCLSCRT